MGNTGGFGIDPVPSKYTAGVADTDRDDFYWKRHVSVSSRGPRLAVLAGLELSVFPTSVVTDVG